MTRTPSGHHTSEAHVLLGVCDIGASLHGQHQQQPEHLAGACTAHGQSAGSKKSMLASSNPTPLCHRSATPPVVIAGGAHTHFPPRGPRSQILGFRKIKRQYTEDHMRLEGLLRAGIRIRDERITKFEVALSAIVAAWEAEDDTALDLALVEGRKTLEGNSEPLADENQALGE